MKIPFKDPKTYKKYMKDYMADAYRRNPKIQIGRNRAALKRKKEGVSKMDENDFNVAETVIDNSDKPKLDLDGKPVRTLLEAAKKSAKDPETDEEDPVFRAIEKGMKYIPVIAEIFKGFNDAAANFKQTQAPPQQKKATMQPPSGWEAMSGLQRMSKKYSSPEWYAAGERWDQYRESGSVEGHTQTSVNTDYVDPSYDQATVHREAKTLAELRDKHPEPPIINDSEPQPQPKKPSGERPDFVKDRIPDKEEKINQNVELINAMKEDNNKYVNLAFDFLGSMEKEKFIKSINDIEGLRKKFRMFKGFIPVQTKEMLKATTTVELVSIFKQQCPDKYEILKELKKIDEFKDLFKELKGDL